MIKSTKVSISESNTTKLKTLDLFLSEYKRVVEQYIEILWSLGQVPKYIETSITQSVQTWLSARCQQAAAKQASGIVRSARKKQEKRAYMIDKLQSEGQYKKARKLQAIYDKNIPKMPNLSNIEAELDSRFFEIDLENNTIFDGWINMGSIGNKVKISLPFKRTKHFNKLYNRGNIKGSIRISRKNVSFSFEIEKPEKKINGSIMGIDIGIKSLISCSNGIQSTKDVHGHDLSSINLKLSRRKRGSKGFQRATEHRTNYINATINKLNLSGVKEIRLENIRNLRKGRRTSRYLQHFVYTEIFDKLIDKCDQEGVLTKRITPTYTSQRCSSCGWVRKRNRSGTQFKCSSCGFTTDADLNASMNISLDLQPIRKEERLKCANKAGFYWLVSGQEHIVPDTLKTKYQQTSL